MIIKADSGVAWAVFRRLKIAKITQIKISFDDSVIDYKLLKRHNIVINRS